MRPVPRRSDGNCDARARRTPRPRRLAPWLAVAAGAALVLAGCGASSSSPNAGAHPTATTTSPAHGATGGSASSCDEAARIATWSVSRRAAQLLVPGIEEDDVAAAEPLVAEGVGGLILFGSSAPADLGPQLSALETHSLGHVTPLVMTDEEGGEIQRMANLVGDMPWPRTMAATMTAAAVESLARRVAKKMRAAGVTMDLAPVLDLSDSPGPDDRYPDGPRSFSVDPTTATTYGLAFARGLEAGGVIPVVKHFPGLGQASYNTDDGPASDPPLAELEKASLVPFKAAIAAGLPAVMVSHASIPGLTGGLPTSLSPAAVTGLLRDRLGFRGLIVTDSLSADAVSDAGYSVAAAAVKAIEAGDDLLPFDTDDPAATVAATVSSIDAAVRSRAITTGRLDAAVEQVLAAKHVSLCG